MNESYRLILWSIVVMVNGLAIGFNFSGWNWILFCQVAFYGFIFFMFFDEEWNKKKESTHITQQLLTNQHTTKQGSGAL